MTLNGGSGNGGAGAARHALSRRRLLGHAARAAVLLAPGLSAAERASAALASRSAPAGLLRVGLSDLGSSALNRASTWPDRCSSGPKSSSRSSGSTRTAS